MFWCSNCLNTSTRPRITFDKKGQCNACQWAKEKKKINWKKRQRQFLKDIKQFKKNNLYDCLVPVSGGKDGSYVSYVLKEKFGLNPLTVTIRPPLESEIGNENLKKFIEHIGLDHIHITPNFEAMQKLNKYGLINKGFPYYGWLISIHTAVLRTAVFFNIRHVIYGEDGEVEYGGLDKTKNSPYYNADYQKKIYLEDGYEKLIKKLNLSDNKKYFFQFPSDDELKNIKITHWSYFENWDPYRNYLIAKEHCGYKEKKNLNEGTFTNFAQNDQALYSLHTYLMYLKFGFGRATQDAGIDIRRGAMTRQQAINLVKIYDNLYPIKYEKNYLDYFKLSKKEFYKILNKWVNKKIFKGKLGKLKLKFSIK